MINNKKHTINVKLLFYSLLLGGYVLSFSSCVSYEEVLNFTEGPEFSSTPEDILNEPIIQIQPNDILSIVVHTLDINAAAPFNAGIEGGSLRAANNTTTLSQGYLVDPLGYIDFPVLGKIKVGGQTIEEAKAIIIEKLGSYLKDPIVNIRFTNFKITVLGEVLRPSTFPVTGEKITVLEALGLAGDVTNYGDRTDVLIVREEGGKRVYGHVNLKDRSIFQSPFFYLKQNDLVYVRPRKEKTATVLTPANRIVPWVSVAVTVANLIVLISINN